MNISTTNAVSGSVSSGAPPSSGQNADGADGLFADSLSAALAATLALTAPALTNQAGQKVGTPGRPAAGAAGQGSLPVGALAPEAALPGLTGGAGDGAADQSQTDALAGVPAVQPALLADHAITTAAGDAQQPAAPPRPIVAPAALPNRIDRGEPPVSPAAAGGMTEQAEAMPIAEAAPLQAGSEPLQPVLAGAARTGRAQVAVNSTGGSLRPAEQVAALAPAPKAPDGSAAPRVPLPSGAAASGAAGVSQEARERRPTMSEHLAQVRAKGADAGSAAPFKAASRPEVPGLPLPQAADDMPIADSRPLAALAETAGTEAGRVEPVDRAVPRPAVQAPPPAQIALHIVRSVPQGVDRLWVQLHPAELGSVEIQLDFADDGSVSAVITAQRPEALDILQRDSRVLERSLQEAGVRLDSDGLTFSLRQDQQQQGQGFDSLAQHRSRTYRAEPAEGAPAAIAQEASPLRMPSLRLLDIRT